MRLLHIACQPVSPNPLQGRAGFAIISITGVSHAYTGPIRSGTPVQWRIPCGVVFRLTFRRRSFSTITTLQTSSPILWYARLRHPASSRVVQKRRTTGSSIYADVFKVHHHSAIIIDAPILISFTLPYSACVFAYMFIYQLYQKNTSKLVHCNKSFYDTKYTWIGTLDFIRFEAEWLYNKGSFAFGFGAKWHLIFVRYLFVC